MSDLGLIFLDEAGKVMFGKFDEGIINDFIEINDENENFSFLQPHQFAVVKITGEKSHHVRLQNLGPIAMMKFTTIMPVMDFLEELSLMNEDEFEKTWSSFYSNLAVQHEPRMVH